MLTYEDKCGKEHVEQHQKIDNTDIISIVLFILQAV